MIRAPPGNPRASRRVYACRMSTTVLVRPRPAARGRRRLRWIAFALLLAMAAGGAAALGALYSRQQAALRHQDSVLAAAVATFQDEMSHAEAGGVDPAGLLPLWRKEQAIVKQAPAAPRFHWFDGGRTGQVARESAAVGALVGAIDRVEAGATATERTAAAPTLSQLSAAVDAARNAGLDVTADAQALAAAQRTVADAASPAAVLIALSGLGDRTASLGQRTAAKLAYDSAVSSARSDASAALTQADRRLSQAQQFPQLKLDTLTAAVSGAHDAFNAAQSPDDFTRVESGATSASDALSNLLAARSTAYADMATARQDVQAAVVAKVDPGTVPAQLDALQTQLDAAGTTDALNAVDGQVTALSGPLQAKTFVATLGQGKVIVISLANQTLDAYDNGNKVVSTLVTTGQPALPTPPGDYTVLRKNSPWEMVSDWPPGTIGWYAPSWVQWVLWFRSDGYGIHDAPWRSTYGPGTEQYGSHGCVNVPASPMATLYQWADIGTRVIVR